MEQFNNTRYALLSALFVFVLWGCWTLAINYSVGVYSALISALSQGFASFLITLFMVKMLYWLYQRVNSRVLKWLVPPFFTLSLTCSGLLLLHLLVGTAEIFYTIVPTQAVACLFSLWTIGRFEAADIDDQE